MMTSRRPLSPTTPTCQTETSISMISERTQAQGGQGGMLVGLRQFWDSVRMTLFVVGGMLLVFACARNSITWHLQRFWGASGNYWQSNWEYIYDDWFGADEYLLATVGTVSVFIGVFILSNLFFIIIDNVGPPKFILKYKIQQDKNVPVDPAMFKKCLFWVAFNAIFVSAPCIFLLYPLMKMRGCSFGRELPTFHWTLFELVMFTLAEEFGFYYGHRLLHQPPFYKAIHKWHHEWTAPISITSIYCHPVEHIIANTIPALMGPVLMGSHLALTWLWLSIVILTTTNSHCGYHFPLMPTPEAHDFHHLKFNNCFGVLGVLDRLHNTDSQFRRTKQYERHYTFLGLTPLTQSIPDDIHTKTGKGKAASSHQD